MTHRIFFTIATGFLTVIAVATCLAANTHDVSPGMKIEHALLVAKRCVLAATAFNDPREVEKWKELRAQDTLEFAGITDAARLSTLRRYIVRNSDIGVNSVGGVKLDRPITYPYLIPNSALANIDKSWTVEKLAQEIRANSGLPYLTYRTTAVIVANCRWHASGNRDELRTDQHINGDLTDTQRVNLKACFQSGTDPKSRTTGYLPGVGITDGEGNFYPYNSSDIAAVIEGEIDSGTYGSLITTIANNAKVDFPPYLASFTLVVNSIRDANILYKRDQCAELSFVFSECFRQTAPAPNAIGKIATIGGMKLSDFGISATQFKSGLTNPNINKLKVNEVLPRNDIPALDPGNIDNKELREIFSLIEKKLEGVR